MLGHDVKYFTSINDKQLLKIAKVEQRVLLTRDFELYQQATARGVDVFIVKGESDTEKLANLAKRFNFKLEIDVNLSRCPKCNSRIKWIPKDKVEGRVLKGTFSSYNDFWECPNCEQLYWQGAHWKRICETLEASADLLN